MLSLSGIAFVAYYFIVKTGSNLTSTEIVKPVIHLGQFRKGESISAKFEIVNHGPSELRIKSVTPDCNCTNVDFTIYPISISDTTIIVVRYDSTISGIFQKKLIVESNSTSSPQVLIFNGEVVN